MEEDVIEPRRDMLLLGDMRDPRSTSMRFPSQGTRGGAPPVPPQPSTRSTAPPPYTPKMSVYGFKLLSEEEERKFNILVERIMENSAFDDDTLIALGFYSDIYKLLDNLGWTTFAVNTEVDHRVDIALEMLVSMKKEIRVINNRGDEAPFLSFWIKDERRHISYESIETMFGFHKSAPEKLEVKEGELDRFWEKISIDDKHTRKSICNIVLQIFHTWMSKRILGRMKEGKVVENELNWIYAALVKKKKINPTTVMINKWLQDTNSGTRKVGMACYLTKIAYTLHEFEEIPRFFLRGTEMDAKFLAQGKYISSNEAR
ncbi:unnamed protein product [Urochloa humidicola]